MANIIVTTGDSVNKLKRIVIQKALSDLITVKTIGQVDLSGDDIILFILSEDIPDYVKGKPWGLAGAFKEGYKFYSQISDLGKIFQELENYGVVKPKQSTEINKELDIKRNPGAAKIIVSTSAKGGSGKTSFALCLGTYMNQSARVLVIDGDLEDAQLGLLYALADDSYANTNMTYEKVEEFIIHNPSNSKTCDILRSPFSPNFYQRISGKSYINMVNDIANSGDYDYIILDTSIRWFSEHERMVAGNSDLLYYVSDLSIGGLLRIRTYLESGNTDGVEFRVIINNSFSESVIKDSSIRTIIGDKPYFKIPSQPNLITFMSMTGNFTEFLDEKDHPEFYKAIDNIAFDLRETL